MSAPLGAIEGSIFLLHTSGKKKHINFRFRCREAEGPNSYLHQVSVGSTDDLVPQTVEMEVKIKMQKHMFLYPSYILTELNWNNSKKLSPALVRFFEIPAERKSLFELLCLHLRENLTTASSASCCCDSCYSMQGEVEMSRQVSTGVSTEGFDATLIWETLCLNLFTTPTSA